MKKTLLSFIALCIFFTGYSQNIGDVFTDNFINYKITSLSPNEVQVNGYSSTGGSLNIPSSVSNNGNSYNVTRVGDSSLSNKNLTGATIPTSVTDIGESAFRDNPNLNSINLHNGISIIGNNAFLNCGLNAINIPTSLTTISEGCFASNNITSITIPSNITSIGEFAFRFNNITTLTIPDNVILIDNLAFDSNSLTSLDLGNGLQTIGNDAFKFNNTLQSVIIPASVTSIGTGAFSLPGLTDVFSESTTPPTITTNGTSTDTFGTFRSNITLHIPPGTTGAYVTNTGALWTGFNSVTEDATLSINNYEIENKVNIIYLNNKITLNSLNDIEFKEYSIYTITGREVKKGKEKEVNVSTLTSGMYVLKLNFDKGIVSKKFLK